MELAYSTGGGVIGAVVTTYVAKQQERRGLRADAHHWLHTLTALGARVRAVEIGAPPRADAPAVAARLGLTAVLDDGTDAHHVLREAFAGLSTAVLAAGMPRRALDFAGGAEERALETELIMLADAGAGGVLGEDAEHLARATREYHVTATRLLLATLWRPWRLRLMLPRRLRRLRAEVGVLHEMQRAALDVLARPRHVNALHERLDPDGQARAGWTRPRPAEVPLTVSGVDGQDRLPRP
jgi:hypothetical protein